MRRSRSATSAWRTGRLTGSTRRHATVGSRVEAGTALPDDFLVGHDLVSVFQVGWTVLHNEVSMYAAERLIEVLDAGCGVTIARFRPDSTRFASRWRDIGGPERRGALGTHWM